MLTASVSAKINNSGNEFFWTDVHTGILRMWSVSKTSPLENFRLKKSGFRSLVVLQSTVPFESGVTPLSRRNGNAEQLRQLNNGTDVACSSSSASAAVIIPPSQLLCTFMDGGVGIYDLLKRRWNFLRELVCCIHLS